MMIYPPYLQLYMNIDVVLNDRYMMIYPPYLQGNSGWMSCSTVGETG